MDPLLEYKQASFQTELEICAPSVLHVGSNTRTGVRISPTTSLPAEKTAWSWLPMRTANGTTFPATTICPTSARKEQVRKGEKTSEERCSEEPDVWAYRECGENHSWGSRLSVRTQRGKDLAAPPHFSVTFKESVENPAAFLPSFIANSSILKSFQLMSQSPPGEYIWRKSTIFGPGNHKIQESGCIMPTFAFPWSGLILSSWEHIRAFFTLDLHTGQTVGWRQGNRCFRAEKEGSLDKALRFHWPDPKFVQTISLM